MEKSYSCGSREAGLSFFDRLIIIAVILAGTFWGMVHFGNILWDYHVLKALAKTVATEYKDLDLKEVDKRVAYELDRNRIDNTDEKFTYGAKDGGGYWASVEVHIPLSISVADYTIAQDKEWVLFHEAGN